MENEKKKIIFYLILVFTFCFLSFASSADAASLYFSPSSGIHKVSQTFSVNIYVSSPDQAMNAASGTVSFPQDKLRVVSISKTGSIFNLWVQEPTFSNTAGTISFEGIVLNPGFIGSAGKILTINFQGRAAGSASLGFSSGSVLANDGKGTNILSSLGSANYTIQISTTLPPSEEEEEEPTITPPPTGVPSAPQVSSSTHPDPNKWYSNNNPEFTWKLPSGVTGVSLLLHQKPTANPGPISDGLIESKNFENVEDGIWYFHIKFKNQYGWGQITHRKVLIDTQPPSPFQIEVQSEDPTDPKPILLFEANDETSGIDYYEIMIDGGKPQRVSIADIKDNSYRIPTQEPGEHLVGVKAFDRAGNFSFSSVKFEISPIGKPKILKFPKRIRMGEVLEIEGKSLPKTTVMVFIQREGKEPILEAGVKTSPEGNWRLAYDKTLTQGKYSFWAQAKDERGALSYQTQKYYFEVGLPPFLKFGKIAIEYLTTMITLILLVVGAIAIVIYTFYRISLWRKRIKKETRETERALRKAFTFLSKEIKKQVEMLDSKPGLNESEKKIRNDLKDALKVAEESVVKEIKDIEKELE